MKKKIAFWLCVLLVLPMALLGCNSNKNGDAVTTPESTPISTTPSDNPPTGTPVETDEARYNRALAFLAEGKIEDAYNLFLSIKEYADVPVYLSRFAFEAAEYTHQDFDPQYGSHYIYRYQYDECGRVLFTDMMDGETKVGSEHFNEYDEHGRLIATGFMVGETRTQVTTYEYDEKGRPILQKDSGGTISLEYDEQDRIVKRVRAWWTQNDTTLYAYDEQGNLIEQIYQLADTSWWDKYTWEYNEYGDVIKHTIQTIVPEGDSQAIVDTVVHTYGNKEKEYDENGNLTKVVYEDGSYTAYEYDEAGNEIKYTIYDSANDYVIFTYTYDKNGNMTEYRREDQSGITSYMYATYDAYGNELERRYTDENGNLTSLSTHTDYKLYYNPNPQKPLPEEMVGKG